MKIIGSTSDPPQAQIKIYSAVKKFEILFNRVNPLRAGIVSRPEDYRWNSLGYHVQTNNRDNFLSTDFGLKGFNVKSKKERIRRYRRYVYEAGAMNRPDKMQAKVIDDKVVAKGEVVVVDEYFGIRIVSLISPEERIKHLR